MHSWVNYPWEKKTLREWRSWSYLCSMVHCYWRSQSCLCSLVHCYSELFCLFVDLYCTVYHKVVNHSCTKRLYILKFHCYVAFFFYVRCDTDFSPCTSWCASVTESFPSLQFLIRSMKMTCLCNIWHRNQIFVVHFKQNKSNIISLRFISFYGEE